MVTRDFGAIAWDPFWLERIVELHTNANAPMRKDLDAERQPPEFALIGLTSRLGRIYNRRRATVLKLVLSDGNSSEERYAVRLRIGVVIKVKRGNIAAVASAGSLNRRR